MSLPTSDQIASGVPIGRAELLTLLHAGLESGEDRFVRQLAEDWLNAYPYDLAVEYARARALHQDGQSAMALRIASRLVDLDPEFVEAQSLLAQLARRLKPDWAEGARAALAVLDKPVEAPGDIQAWAQSVIHAQIALAKGNLQEAESQVQAALLAEPPSPLPALLHLDISHRQQLSWLALDKLLELYRSQWPQALPLRLMQADYLMESGQQDEAVDLLHDCVAEDVAGQVPRRLWGDAHRFSALWPAGLRRAVSIPIPSSVAAGLGWNSLADGVARQPVEEAPKVVASEEEAAVSPVHVPGVEEKDFHPGPIPVAKAIETGDLDESSERAETKAPAPPKPVFSPEVLLKADQEPETPLDLEDLYLATAEDLELRADGRYPAYVVLTTRSGLEKQYGRPALTDIDAALRAVVKATAALPDWDAHLVYADEAASVGKFGLEPAKADDPWAIKVLLQDLDEALRKKGEMIGALLIVGGPQIVPFHRLPNPVDDDDKDVPSDNPYAAVDENYFVPTWPLGRLPGGNGADPAPLLKGLARIAASRGNQGAGFKPRDLLDRLLRLFGMAPSRASFGYTAEIWRRASHSVFRPIGEARRLSISPPADADNLPKEAVNPLQLAYFNLHGLEDAPEWYGQRDPLETPEGPDYPVALSPVDVVNHGHAPQIVFSEACFGANILDKDIEDALALKFLVSGSKAVVGSTCTAYGSVTTPLIAADLLGQTFWKLLNEGHPAGEALRRAKIALAKAMHRRQGYLDGEDQKTLIAFLLYGDPLAQAASAGMAPKRILRPAQNAPEMRAVCDRAEHRITAPQDIPAETLATVKSVVEEYLPGMGGSQLTISHEHTHCTGHDCPLPHSGAKALPGLAPNRRLVTLSKRVQDQSHDHPSYARITMDQHGKVVKLAVSR